MSFSGTQLLDGLIGRKLERLGLLVWPSFDNGEPIDMHLFLSVKKAEDAVFSVTVRIGPDGQTPVIQEEAWAGGMPIGELSTDSAEENEDAITYRLYELSHGESVFGVRLGELISGVSVVRFVDDRNPTGIVITFSSNASLWIGPKAFGTAVKLSQDEFYWPSAIEVVKLRPRGGADEG